MSNHPTLWALLLSGCIAPAAHAQHLSPGLWENAVSIKSAGGQMEAAMAQAQKELAQMPPDQRKMMQDMMARQGMGMSPQGTTTRVCISKAQAERDDIPQQEGNCKRETLQRSGKTVKFRFTCSAPNASSGEGEYTMTSDKAYSGRTVVNTTVNGKTERMDMTVNGKWLSADCGSVKPLP